VTSETATLKAQIDVNPEMREALIADEDGMFRRGALPQMQCATAAGSKELLEAVAKVDWL